ncbi:MAG: cupredoxin domain-containing protein [Chloroflexi bacterium]|nr:cupredoxin domain-containing protein [Chloroflexota bacterium]
MADTNSNRTPVVIATAVVVAGAIALIGFVVLALSTGGDTASDPDQTPFVSNEDTVELTIVNFLYSPSDLTIDAGTTVTWTNVDGAVHDATDRDHSWNTDLLEKGEAGEVTFGEAGTFEYFCSIHPWMEGSIIVR